MAKTRKTKNQLEREIAAALAEVDRKIASAGIRDGDLYWPGRRGAPVVKPHPRTSASCKTCGRFHSTGEHKRHAGTRGPAGRANKAPPKTPKKARGGAKRGKAREEATPTPPARREPLEVVREAVLSAPASDRFGDRKVFISKLWDRTRGELGMRLEEFKRWLVDAHMTRRLLLARADLVAAMDPELVAKSLTTPEGESYPEFHFVVDESK